MSPRGTGWLVALGTVVVGAAAQAATAVPGLGTASTPVLVADAVVSVVVLVLELALLAWAARAIVHRTPLGRVPGTVLLWSVVVVVVLAAVGIVVAFAVPLDLVAALRVLPAASRGERNALRGFRVFRRTPVRAVVAAVVTVLLTGLAWVAALAAGLFLTGALGGFAMWLVLGVLLALLLIWWTRLAARAGTPHDEPTDGPGEGPRDDEPVAEERSSAA